MTPALPGEPLRVDGAVAIVTGGGRGIGRAVALVLAAAGARVAVAARTPSEVDETAAAITGAGGTALAVTADVTLTADVEALVRTTTSELGPPDILVNPDSLVNRGLPTGRWVCLLSAIDLVGKQVWINVDDQRSVTRSGSGNST